MAYYTYDEEADAFYILLVPDDEAAIDRTEELSANVHVDLDPSGRLVGVEILYPSDGGADLALVNEQYGLNLKLPFNFAA